mmetsp:Transcript_10210/g.30823  ORF Transcript_10210/g.30823 Transcript_10210/m.30823 type:complete len:271 (+) Transcript_10210:746-1558(+)
MSRSTSTCRLRRMPLRASSKALRASAPTPVKLASFWPLSDSPTDAHTAAAMPSATFRSMRRFFMSSSAGARSSSVRLLLPVTRKARRPRNEPKTPLDAAFPDVAAATALFPSCSSSKSSTLSSASSASMRLTSPPTASAGLLTASSQCAMSLRSSSSAETVPPRRLPPSAPQLRFSFLRVSAAGGVPSFFFAGGGCRPRAPRERAPFNLLTLKAPAPASASSESPAGLPEAPSKGRMAGLSFARPPSSPDSGLATFLLLSLPRGVGITGA